MKKLKLYIVVRKGLSPGMACTACAHASLGLYLRHADKPEVREWVLQSFKKVILVCSDDLWEALKDIADHEVFTESSMGSREIAMAFVPREKWPRLLQDLPLYA